MIRHVKNGGETDKHAINTAIQEKQSVQAAIDRFRTPQQITHADLPLS